MSSEIMGKAIPLYLLPLIGKDVLIRDERPGWPAGPLAPGGCPGRRWLASRRVAGGRRPAAAIVHRGLLDPACAAGRARPARLPHHRGRAEPAVRRPLRG